MGHVAANDFQWIFRAIGSFRDSDSLYADYNLPLSFVITSFSAGVESVNFRNQPLYRRVADTHVGETCLVTFAHKHNSL